MLNIINLFCSLESFVLVDDILKQYPALSSGLVKVGSQLPVVTISKSAFLDGAKSSIYYPFLKKYCTTTTEDVRLIRAEDVTQMEGKLKHMQETLDTYNQCSPDIPQDFLTDNDDFEFEVCSDVSYDLEVSSDGSVEYFGNAHAISQATFGQNEEACVARSTDDRMLPSFNSSNKIRKNLFGSDQYETVNIDSSKFHCFNDVDQCFESESIEMCKKTDLKKLDHWMYQTAETPRNTVSEHQAIVATSNDIDPESSMAMDTENSMRDNSCESTKSNRKRLQHLQEDMMPNSDNKDQSHSTLKCGDPILFGTNLQEWFGVHKKKSSECIPGDMTKSTTSVVLPKPCDRVLER